MQISIKHYYVGAVEAYAERKRANAADKSVEVGEVIRASIPYQSCINAFAQDELVCDFWSSALKVSFLGCEPATRFLINKCLQYPLKSLCFISVVAAVKTAFVSPELAKLKFFRIAPVVFRLWSSFILLYCNLLLTLCLALQQPYLGCDPWSELRGLPPRPNP